MTSLSQLNAGDEKAFVAVCGPLFEHSPWVAERAAHWRPFRSRVSLHSSLCEAMLEGADVEKMALIRAHPDLVGRLAREGRLTRESTGEQAAAGLADLTPAEADTFDRYNAAYRERFGFPFIICARENKKAAILAAFPLRLANTREDEVVTALGEIISIAWYRLLDAVSE